MLRLTVVPEGMHIETKIGMRSVSMEVNSLSTADLFLKLAQVKRLLFTDITVLVPKDTLLPYAWHCVKNLKGATAPGGEIQLVLEEGHTVRAWKRPSLEPVPFSVSACVLSLKTARGQFRLHQFHDVYMPLEETCGFPPVHVVRGEPPEPADIGDRAVSVCTSIWDNVIQALKMLRTQARVEGAEWGFFFEDDALPCPGAKWEQLWPMLHKTHYSVVMLGNSAQCRVVNKSHARGHHKIYPVALHHMTGGYAMAVRVSALDKVIGAMEKRRTLVHWDTFISLSLSRTMPVGVCTPVFFTHPNNSVSERTGRNMNYGTLSTDITIMQAWELLPRIGNASPELWDFLLHSASKKCKIQQQTETWDEVTRDLTLQQIKSGERY